MHCCGAGKVLHFILRVSKMFKNMFLLAAACALAAALPASAQTPPENSAQTAPARQPLPLSLSRVERNLGAKGVYLFDCNPKEIYDRSHLPGAVFTNVENWTKLLPADRKDSFLIFYCINTMCNVSYEAALEAIRQGYENVYVMPEGIQGWVRGGYEFEGTGREDPALKAAKAKHAAK